MSLCLNCGLCCDGTMYSSVYLEERDDAAQLTQLDITLMSGKAKHYFKQPCSAFKCSSCSIYEVRPTICREYRCGLLKRHDTGNITTEQALSLIKNTAELSARVRQAVEQFVGAESNLALPKLFQLFNDKFASLDAEVRKQVNPEMQLDIGMLRVLLSRHFEVQDTTLGESGDKKISNESK